MSIAQHSFGKHYIKVPRMLFRRNCTYASLHTHVYMHMLRLLVTQYVMRLFKRFWLCWCDHMIWGGPSLIYRVKLEEKTAEAKMYCPRPSCSTFIDLGKLGRTRPTFTCPGRPSSFPLMVDGACRFLEQHFQRACCYKHPRLTFHFLMFAKKRQVCLLR